MILRIQKYQFTLVYKLRKTMYLADIFSRAHTAGDKDPIIEQADISVVTYLPMSEKRLSEIKRETAEDNASSRPSFEDGLKNTLNCSKS